LGSNCKGVDQAKLPLTENVTNDAYEVVPTLSVPPTTQDVVLAQEIDSIVVMGDGIVPTADQLAAEFVLSSTVCTMDELETNA
jgi:hypothetical protein